MDSPLTPEEQSILLRLARTAMEQAVRGEDPPAVDLAALTPQLRELGASFVTLTIQGDLRGCIGALEPAQPLAADVRDHAIAAALDDPRFTPVQPEELQSIHIEISRLTFPRDIDYADATDLLGQLRPGVDGVILRDGGRRATFLPQVWEKIPHREGFLDQLCVKMGAAPTTWRKKHLKVQVYQVEEFHE